MSSQQGTFIVIEGSDGSGKRTQFDLVRTQLVSAGYDVVTFDFPQYDEPSSYFVRQYLGGAYGTLDEVGPYTSSLFFALDRYEAAAKIRAALAEGKVVLANRYVGSNMAHQGTKFRHAEERRGYFIWLDNLEFEMLGIPRPTVSFVLRVPAEISLHLIEQREQDAAEPKQRDIHESSLEHLQLALTVFDDMCQLFPKDFVRIDCVRDGKLLDVPKVQDIVWQKIVPFLPEVPKRRSAATPTAEAATITQSPYLHKNEEGIYEVTAAGRAFLESVVTNVDSNVYSFTGTLAPAVIATAMAQRAQRVDDLRLILLQEYSNQTTGSQNNVLTDRADASAKQLTGIYMVVENASNLLTKKLEWGRLASYLELSSPFTYLDQKDAKGTYAYYTPPELDAVTKQQYRAHMDQLFDLYADMIDKLTTYLQETSLVPVTKRNAVWDAKVRTEACQAAASVLPVATTTTVGIFAAAASFESLIRHLLSDELPEAQTVGWQMLGEARKSMPTFLEGVEAPDAVDGTVSYKAVTHENLKRLVEAYVSNQHASTAKSAAVQLVDIWPRNEFDLLPDMLYEDSNLSLKELQQTVATWPYDKKLEVFTAYMGDRKDKQHVPGRALEKVHYSWDLMCEYDVFRALQRHHMVDDLEWQMLTPRYGYNMPSLIEEAGLEEQFEGCFDISLRLYSLLQEKGYEAEAQYVTLLGHKLRWKVIYNAREAFHLHENTGGYVDPRYRQFVLAMHEKLSEAHPVIGQAMKFV
jgi:thymidylate kinase/thymidylate synthase ThyX